MSTKSPAMDLLRRPGTGIFTVTIGDGWTDRLLARWAGHRRGGRVPSSLAVTPLPLGGELWTRSFDGHEVASSMVWDREAGRLAERFRGMRLEFTTTVAGEGVVAELCSAGVALGPFTVPLPSWAMPAVTVTTRRRVAHRHAGVEEDALHVRVEVGTGGGGRSVLTYEGVLS